MINKKKTTPRCIIGKLLKTYNKADRIKATRKERPLYTKYDWLFIQNNGKTTLTCANTGVYIQYK